MSLRLHWSPDSANLPVRIALEMFGLPYEAIRVDRAAKEHHSAEYLEKNPQGLIPVLEDGELAIFETGAILWHLAQKVEKFGPNGPSMSDDAARSAALSWIFYLSNTVHADLRIGFYPQRYVQGGECAGPLCEGVAKRMLGHFDLIERSRLIGQSTTLPEIYLAALVRWAQLYPRNRPIIADLDRWSSIQEMCVRVESNAAARRAFAAESIPQDQAITSPRLPDLPLSQVTGI